MYICKSVNLQETSEQIDSL